MKSLLSMLVLCSMVLTVLSIEEESGTMNDIEDEYMQRQLLKCVSESDCLPNECSVMGMQRFSEPRCEARGRLNEPCIEDNEPENRTLAFPNGNLMECQSVYMQFCPCSSGLVCHQNRCQRPRRPFQFRNSIRYRAVF